MTGGNDNGGSMLLAVCSICGARHNEGKDGAQHFDVIGAGRDARRPGEHQPELWVCGSCMGGADATTWRRGYLDAKREADERKGRKAYQAQTQREGRDALLGEVPTPQVRPVPLEPLNEGARLGPCD